MTQRIIILVFLQEGLPEALERNLGPQLQQLHYQKIEYGKVIGKITHWDKLEDLFNVPQRKLREIEENYLDKEDNRGKH